MCLWEIPRLEAVTTSPQLPTQDSLKGQHFRAATHNFMPC